MDAPPRSLRSALLAVAARWPTLLAWFLAGWLGRALLLRLAGRLGNVDVVWGVLVLALAVLVRLVSYVAVFLVVRDALQGVRPDPATAGLRGGARRLSSSLLEAVLPFLLIYAAWSIIREDVVAYARSAVDQVDWSQPQDDGLLSVPLSLLPVTLVVVAFGLKTVLTWLGDRLPRWTGAVTVYCEAVWVLITVLVLGNLLAGLPAWLEDRRLVAWGLDRLDELRASFAWVAALLDGLGPAWGVVTDVVLLPLAWLALAGVVFAEALARPSGAHDPRAVDRVRQRYGALPTRWQRAVAWATEGLTERWEPVRRVGTLAWRAGPLPVAAYLVVFAVVSALPAWLDVGFNHLAGPRELGWWGAVDSTEQLLIDAVTVPLQLAAVATALFVISARAEDRWRARGAATASAAAAV